MVILQGKVNKSGILPGRSLLAAVFILISTFLNVSGQKVEVISPHYVLPEFTKGKVLLKSGVVRELKMNYNLITEEMIFEYPGKYLALTDIGTIDTVFILDRKFIPSGKIFHEVLLKTPAVLFARYACDIIPPGKEAGYGTTSQTTSIMSVDQLFSSRGRAYDLQLPDDYVITPRTEFLLQKDGELVRIYNIKQVIKAYPEKEALIKKYAKDTKIDFKNQEDVISIIKFCNN
jgi:hypothetical protein